jgi:DNA modification methylase
MEEVMSRRGANLALKVEYLPTSKIGVLPGNPRRHSATQIALIAASMAEHGNINPLLIDEDGVVIAGEARLEAARLAGMERVPAIRLRHLTAAQKRLYRIADNRIAEQGSSWSIPDLVAEFGRLEIEMPALDLQLSGFTLDDIDGYRDAQDAAEAASDEDAVPPAEVGPSISRLGDCWAIGPHRLVCGDATSAGTYLKLLGRERADMIFGDPPYNVPIVGHVSGLGKAQHREFVQASGEMSAAEFKQFLLTFMRHCVRFAKPGALHYLCMDWRGLSHLLSAGEAAYGQLINICVWAKSNAGMGSLYRSAHELVAIFKSSKASHRNNVQLGASGRHRTNVWNYPGMTVPSRARSEALAVHPTVKPLALVRDAILDVTVRGDIVLDPFGGSGTTLLAADRIGRLARLIELDPLYCDVILRRAAKALKVEPVLIATDETMDQVSARRAGEGADV